MMNRHLLNQRRWFFTVLLVSLALSMVLSACNQDSGNGSSTGTTKPPVAAPTRPASLSSYCASPRSLGGNRGHERYTESGGGAVRLPDGRSLTANRGQGTLRGHRWPAGHQCLREYHQHEPIT